MQSTDTKAIDTALKSVAGDEPLSIRISGTCMAPLIDDGAMIQIRRQRLYLPGDILVKRCHNGQLVAHRLIGFYPRYRKFHYVTRADNASSADAAIAGSRVFGKVCGGECVNSAIQVPLSHRSKACVQFTSLMLQRLAARITRLI